MDNNEKHEFGGPWTEVKLAAIEAYAKFYTGALKNKGFETWYIDAFAGTGVRNTKIQTGGLFESQPISEEDIVLDGSASKALAISPPFDHLVYIEQRFGRHKALQQLADENANRDIKAIRGDANEQLQKLFTSGAWQKEHNDNWKQRSLVFLDPYGMSVDFKTLETLAQSKQADVWYLVSLKGIVQQLSHDHSKMDEDKRQSLNRMMGTNDWEDTFYEFKEVGRDLFDVAQEAEGRRSVTRDQVSNFFKERLNSIFYYVSDPLPLKVGNQEDFFQLYCMSNNSNGKAIGLISKGVDWVVNKYSQASHQMSDL